MMAGDQDIGHGAVAPYPRSRILRIFQQADLETLIGQAFRMVDHPRQQTHDRIDQNDRGRLTAGQNKIADADFLDSMRFENALIDAFVAAAHDNNAGLAGELAYPRLIEGPTPRG